jgi:hypothetical protein
VIDVLPDFPEPLLGFRFSGHVTRDEYTQTLLPPLKEQIARGAKIRLAVVIDDDFDQFEAGALWEDLKFGFGSGLAHLSAWERMALVSDAKWVHHAISLFGWLVPGDVRVLPLAQLDDAKAWLSEPNA